MDRGRQELIRRVVDGELSADEARPEGREGDRFAREVQASRRAVELLAELNRPVDPGPQFTAQVMAALPERPAERGGALQRLGAWLARPVRLPAGALAAAALLLLGLALLPWLRGGVVEPRESTPPPQPVAAAAPETCAQQREVLVRFQVRAPDARVVHLSGDFNDWSESGTPLSDLNGDQVWTVTVPLTPGRYQYRFLVDGERWVVDPEADGYVADGFGGVNALLTL